MLAKLYDVTWGRVFASGYDWFLGRVEEAGLARIRHDLVRQAAGRTLELGVGTGLNLPHYTDAVSELVMTEPYPRMLEQLERAVTVKRPPHVDSVKVLQAAGESLPFPDKSFDTVLATMLLCSAARPDQVLREIARVLKPGGRYLFFEHVRNTDRRVAKRQDRLQPLWGFIGYACHCNRPTVDTLRAAPLELNRLEYSEIPHGFSIIKQIVIGEATPRVGSSGELALAAPNDAACSCC